MLTKEILRQNAAFAELSDDVLSQIEQMSRNDEETVIGKRIGEIHQQYDKTIFETTGIARNGDEKSYKYLERAAKALREKVQNADSLNDKIATREKDKEELQKKITEGGGEELQAVNAELAKTKKQYNELKKQMDEREGEYKKQLFDVQVGFDMSQAVSGLKLRADIPEAAARVLVESAVNKVKTSYNPEYVETNGVKKLVFKDENGVTLNNPQNNLEPYTAKELLQNELKTMGILDEGRRQTGGGTHGGSGGSGGGSSVDISGAKTQVEANDLIKIALNKQGLVYGSSEYQQAFDKAWVDNNITQLPLQ